MSAIISFLSSIIRYGMVLDFMASIAKMAYDTGLNIAGYVVGKQTVQQYEQIMNMFNESMAPLFGAVSAAALNFVTNVVGNKMVHVIAKWLPFIAGVVIIWLIAKIIWDAI